MSDRLAVGRIVKPHGIRGEVSVEVYSEAPERFAKGKNLFEGERTLTVEASRQHHARLLVKFQEVATRNEAEALRGAELWIAPEEAAPLQDWSFYPHQLEGAEVFDESGAVLGTLVRVDENPANDLWVVVHNGREILVPAVRQIVVSVDLDAKRIVVSPPEGLFQ